MEVLVDEIKKSVRKRYREKLVEFMREKGNRKLLISEEQFLSHYGEIYVSRFGLCLSSGGIE